MDALTSLFNSIFDVKRLASITVPGLIAALAITLALWVSRQADLVMVPKGMDTTHINAQTRPQFLYPCTPADPATLQYERPEPRDANDDYVVRNQRLLEYAHSGFQECITMDAQHLFDDSASVENGRALVQFYSAQRDSLQRLSLSYERTGSPLRATTTARVQAANAQAEAARARVQKARDSVRSIRTRIAVESLYIARLDERLKDPARWKPGQGVDDLLAAAANHAIAFLVLTGLCGMILGPIQEMLFGWMFDGFVAAWWNRKRPGRFWIERPSRQTEDAKQAQNEKVNKDHQKAAAMVSQLRTNALNEVGQ